MCAAVVRTGRVERFGTLVSPRPFSQMPLDLSLSSHPKAADVLCDMTARTQRTLRFDAPLRRLNPVFMLFTFNIR